MIPPKHPHGMERTTRPKPRSKFLFNITVVRTMHGGEALDDWETLHHYKSNVLPRIGEYIYFSHDGLAEVLDVWHVLRPLTEPNVEADSEEEEYANYCDSFKVHVNF